MVIPWEDQLSSYSRSTNGSLRGKALMKYKQKWWDIWRTGMHSFTMCRLCFPPALCLVQCCTFSQVRRGADQVLLHWIKNGMVLPCAPVRAHTLAVSYNSASELLRQMLVLRICQSKDVFFFSPFPTVQFSWDTAPCQANVSFILGRDVLKCFT